MPPTDPKASRPRMPSYGLAPAEEGEGLLPWSWARDRLAAARNYFLSTTRPDGSPHVMVIWGLWVDDAFYFCTSKSSAKARNLAAQPRCVLCPGDADEAVIVEGAAVALDDREHFAALARVYQEKYGWDIADQGDPMFVFRPRVAYGQIEETFTKSATRWEFGQGAIGVRKGT